MLRHWSDHGLIWTRVLTYSFPRKVEGLKIVESMAKALTELFCDVPRLAALSSKAVPLTKPSKLICPPLPIANVSKEPSPPTLAVANADTLPIADEIETSLTTPASSRAAIELAIPPSPPIAIVGVKTEPIVTIKEVSKRDDFFICTPQFRKKFYETRLSETKSGQMSGVSIYNLQLRSDT